MAIPGATLVAVQVYLHLVNGAVAFRRIGGLGLGRRRWRLGAWRLGRGAGRPRRAGGGAAALPLRRQRVLHGLLDECLQVGLNLG